MNTLEHLTVVVTRPVHQAEHFAAQLASLGAAVIQLPTLDIQFRHDPVSAQEQQHLATSSLWIFTSANSVAGASTLGVIDKQPPAKIACIGLSTAAALQKRNIEPDYVPASNSNSEGLLEILDSAAIPASVTIIQGGKGRDALHRELTGRGSMVHSVDVYQRCLPTPGQSNLQHTVNAMPCCISITSNQGLSNLTKLIPMSHHKALFESTLVVNSRRCETFARRTGFIGTITVADPPGDRGQLQAILQL